MYCQVIKPHKSDFDFFKNLKFPLFRHNKEMGPYTVWVLFGLGLLFKICETDIQFRIVLAVIASGKL